MKPLDRVARPLSNRSHADRWEVPFPFEWDADDLVSRRQILRLAVLASGALFAATGVLAALGYARDRTQGGEQAIARTSDVPVGGVLYFTYPTKDDHAILLQPEPGRFVAFSGRCTHLSCAVYWNAEKGKLHCPCHNGVFDPRTGDALAGPPSRPLPPIRLRQDGETIYAVEELPG
ncbi:MAG TPA: Rieske (2Fe-2S) protein [Thermomicrobiales bacterium]|jgi:Rieske Fe-S protein